MAYDYSREDFETMKADAKLCAQEAKEKTYRKIQCKCRAGISCRWTVGKTKNGKFKAVGVRSAQRGFPSDFLPFEVMDAVLGRWSPRFDTLDEAEMFVRSL